MTPEMAKKWLPIIQAVAEGRTIQKAERKPGELSTWVDCEIESSINWCPDFIRVKPDIVKPREFWLVRESGGPWIGVFDNVSIANQVVGSTRKIIHVREVIDE